MKATGLFLLALLFIGCASTATKRQATLAKAVYAEDAAIKAGRFDLAKAYGKQAVRLLPPPKKPIAVKPVESKGKEIVIVPKADAGLQDVAIDSPALNTLETEDKGLQGQLRADKVAVEKEAKATDSALRAESKDASKAEASKPSIFSRILKYSFFGFPILLVVGAIVVCVFFPALIPLFAEILGKVYSFVASLVNSLIGVINKWLK